MEKLFKKETISGIFEYLGRGMDNELKVFLVEYFYENQDLFVKYLNDSFEIGEHIFDLSKL